jgi:hypothetical protein
MHSPRRTADLLDKRLRAWQFIMVPRDQSQHLDNLSNRGLISQHDPNARFTMQEFLHREVEVVSPHGLGFVTPEKLENSWNHELRLSEEHAVSLGFAIGEVLTARGRLLDMLEAIEQCWPNREAWCANRRRRSAPERILGGTSFGLSMSLALQRELVLGNLNRLLENPGDEQSEEHESIPELELLYEYRDAKARLRALSEINATYIQDEQIDQIAYHFPKRHFSPEREKIEWLAREYIFNERLFSWSKTSKRERYRFIYEQANLGTLDLHDADRTYLQNVVRYLELAQASSEDVFEIISRVALFVQIFGYQHFVEDVMQDGGQWGSSSGIGSREKVNLVPGRKAAACHGIFLGAARGRKEKSKGSLKNVMRGLRAHLRQCGEITKVAIVTTDVWDKESFDESLNDLARYKRQGTKFLFLLINGRRLISMDLLFT